jgi:hypothetical protein
MVRIVLESRKSTGQQTSPPNCQRNLSKRLASARDASGLVNYAILGSAAAGLRHEVAGLNVALSPARGD